MKSYYLLMASLVFALLFPGTGSGPLASEAPKFSYQHLDRVLKKYVNPAGFVDYRGLQKDRAHLDLFVKQVEAQDRGAFNRWTEQEKIAFWINTYNALTLKLIIDHYPVKSIKDLGNVFTNVWEKYHFRVMGKPTTLNAIEHEILRREFREARIHVAINCASIGCPPLLDRSYLPETLEDQLAAQSRVFLSSPVRFKIDRAAGVVRLSPILKWFGEDFEHHYGNGGKNSRFNATEEAVLNFVAAYTEGKDKAFVEQRRFKIKYLDYDWKLNRQ